MNKKSLEPSRRVFVQAAIQGLGAMMVGCGRDQGVRNHPVSSESPEGSSTGGSGAGGEVSVEPGEGGAFAESLFPHFDDLLEPNELGVRLPPGYSVRVIATSGLSVPGHNFVWPAYPDGGATFAQPDGGWVYACNSEIATGGGASALRFDKVGEIVAAYSLITGTRMNCQGGASPQGTWLTCEEMIDGGVYECDPLGEAEPIFRPGLGLFRHEGLAYDLVNQHIYLTEDVPDGRLYRFVPDALTVAGYADLTSGELQVAKVRADGFVTWLPVEDPLAAAVPTRHQVPDSTPFLGAEGIWWQDGVVYFVTKGDNAVRAYDVRRRKMSILYEASTAVNPILTGVDGLLGASGGELLVSEDGGDMQIVVILPSGELKPLMQIVGHDFSEVTGLAFDPSGTRLYFSSQRGLGQGITYEMSGPFASSKPRP